jgi:hypothetical protein
MRGHHRRETFSADAATVTFTGDNIHRQRPHDQRGSAADFVADLPRTSQTPEKTTDGRDGHSRTHHQRRCGGNPLWNWILRPSMNPI